MPDERGDAFFHQEVFQASREIAINITRKLLLQEKQAVIKREGEKKGGCAGIEFMGTRSKHRSS